MTQPPVIIALVAAAACFGAASAVLAMMGLGVPFLLGAAGAAFCAGLVVHGVAARLLPTPQPPPDPVPDPVPDPAADLAQARIRELEERAAVLRHDLRGVLSPALMVSDRLLRSPDPAVKRAGEAVVRTVERATALLADSKRAAAPGDPQAPKQ